MLEGDTLLPPPREFRKEAPRPVPSVLEREVLSPEHTAAADVVALHEEQKPRPEPLKVPLDALTTKPEDPALPSQGKVSALEERIARLEEQLRRTKVSETKVPDRVPEVPAQPVEVVTPPVSAAPQPQARFTNHNHAPVISPPAWVTQRPKRTAKSFTPEAQALRKQARDAFVRITTNFSDSEALMEARTGLAQMALDDADVVEALRQYERLIAERPNSTAALTARLDAARLHRELGDHAAAHKHFFAFVDCYPRDRNVPTAMYEAATTLQEAGRKDEALRAYLDVERRFTGSKIGQDARRSRADLLRSLSRNHEALDVYGQMTAVNDLAHGDYAHGMLQIAKIHMAEQKPQAARETLNRLLAIRCAPEIRGRAMKLLGDCFSDELHPLDAAGVYTQTADEHPQMEDVLECRILAARQFAAAGLCERAAAQYRKALQGCATREARVRSEIEPTAMLGLARSCAEAGDGAQARKLLSDIRTRWPDSSHAAEAGATEAELLVAENKFDAASAFLGDLASAYRGTPMETRALLRKAELDERRKDTRSAITAYEKVGAAHTQADPASLDFRRAVFLMGEGKSEEALVLLRRIAGRKDAPKPYAALAAHQAALALEKLGRLEEAIQTYQEFVKTSGAAGTSKELQELVTDARWKVQKLTWLRSLPGAVAQKRQPASAP